MHMNFKLKLKKKCKQNHVQSMNRLSRPASTAVA